MSANAQYLFYAQLMVVLEDAWNHLGFPVGTIIAISLLVAMTFGLLHFFESNRLGG